MTAPVPSEGRCGCRVERDCGTQILVTEKGKKVTVTEYEVRKERVKVGETVEIEDG